MASRNPVHCGGCAAHVAWSTINASEALPGVVTPLTWSFYGDAVERAMRGAFCDLGVLRRSEVRAPGEPEHRLWDLFYGRAAGNLNTFRQLADRMPGTNGNAIEEQIFGPRVSGIDSTRSYRRYPVVAVKLPRLALAVPVRLARLRAEIKEWWRRETAPAALADAAAAPARFAEARRRFQAVMRPHSVATMLAQAMYEQVRSLAEGAGLAGLETSLITGYGEMEEAQVAADLWDASRDRLSFDEFVARHGYHGPSEGSLSSRTWREDDSPLRALVATYRTMSEDADPRAVAEARMAARIDAETRLLVATPALHRARTRLILRLASRHIPLREVGKAAFLQAVDVGRAAARSYGAHLAEACAIADPEDVFFLTAEELLGELPADAEALVAARRAKRVDYLELRLPETWKGAAEPVPVEAAGGERPDRVEGIAVSPGAIEGRARVVLDPDSGIEIEPGEVLVCQTTDPSWASFFLVASGLVIDIGGAMSHGAIVARELGIPCVINTGVGTSAIRTGDLLRVDGGSGRVEVVERGKSEVAA